VSAAGLREVAHLFEAVFWLAEQAVALRRFREVGVVDLTKHLGGTFVCSLVVVVEDREEERCSLKGFPGTTRILSVSPYLLEVVAVSLDVAHVRDVAVPETSGAFHRDGFSAADYDRWATFANGLRLDFDGIELEMLALVAGFAFGPMSTQDLNRFVRSRSAIGDWGVDGLEFRREFTSNTYA